MDNKAIATLLYETADLLEIDGQDSFRVRSYRNAAEAIEALPQQVADLVSEPKKLLEIQGIGKGMQANLVMLFKDGHIEAHAELLKKYRPSMLELLKIQGLGPKTIALIWSAYQVSDLEGVEKLAREGKIRTLPRMGEKHEAKLLKAIEDYRRIAGRFLLDVAEELRWLEYGQRLALQRRGVLRSPGRSLAGGLFERCAKGGRQALAQPVGAFAPGSRADFLVLEEGDECETPSMNRYVFKSGAWRVRDVIVAGGYVVRDGHHAQEEAIRRRAFSLLPNDADGCAGEDRSGHDDGAVNAHLILPVLHDLAQDARRRFAGEDIV